MNCKEGKTCGGILRARKFINLNNYCKNKGNICLHNN